MPKLSKVVAKKVDSAEEWGQGRQLLEEGRYAARLRKVEVREGESGRAGSWSWWLTKIHDEDGKGYGGTQFLNTSLSEKAFGRLKQVFNAFGYTSDSDTDEMLGEWVGIYVTQERQAQGKNAGKMRNEIQYVFEFVADEWAFDPDGVGPDQEREEQDSSGDTF